MSASAAERGAASVMRAEAGTLPLVAAMGIGIAVAAIAVIAFLQMTTRAKSGLDNTDNAGDESEPPWTDIDSDGESPFAAAEPQQETAAGGNDRADADSEDGLPDYTIPLTAHKALPQPAMPAVRGRPSLQGLEGEFAGSGFQVPDSWLTLGRDASLCGLIFPQEAGEVSRKHCSLRYEAQRGLFLLEDHHSSNGTFLPGERLAPGVIYELAPGSRFAISGRKHWFEVRI